MSSLASKKQAVAARMEVSLRKVACIGEGTPRHAQLLALILIPFVFVVAMTASGSIKDIVESLVPNTGAMTPLLFLVGLVLFIASLFLCFVWVRTGGFHIFE